MIVASLCAAMANGWPPLDGVVNDGRHLGMLLHKRSSYNSHDERSGRDDYDLGLHGTSQGSPYVAAKTALDTKSTHTNNVLDKFQPHMNILESRDRILFAQRTKRSNVPPMVIVDSDTAWTLCVGLGVLGLIITFALVCCCCKWSAWIRSADGKVLYPDVKSPIHCAYPAYDNLAFSTLADETGETITGVVIIRTDNSAGKTLTCDRSPEESWQKHSPELPYSADTDV